MCRTSRSSVPHIGGLWNRLSSLALMFLVPSPATAFTLPAAPRQISARGAVSHRMSAVESDVNPTKGVTRTRFAPSPTGSLHVGGARTALFSWLKARQDGGSFLVRVEDTDTARSTRESEESVLADLRWLGLDWDEGPGIGGEKGPYRQSERKENGLYKDFARKLMDSGHAYPCFYTAEEVEAKRAEAEATGKRMVYEWAYADPADAQKRIEAGEPYAIRFKIPKDKFVSIEDSVRGKVTWEVENTFGDFILIRSNGMPVYNFCAAVDDALMGITNVIRAEEHLTNTVRQFLVLEALGFPIPTYGHLSLVLGEDRSKLSKRHGATSVDQFRLDGFLPEAMMNYLCTLGWNDGTEKEIYTIDELVEAFSLDRITKSPAVFDMNKLRWINGQHLRALPTEKLADLISNHFLETGLMTSADPKFASAAAAMAADKVDIVGDAEGVIRDALMYPLEETLASDAAAAFLSDGFPEVARAVVDAYKDGELPDPIESDFASAWKKWVKGIGKTLGRKGKGLFMPLRICMTGRMMGPDIAAQLQVLAYKSAELQFDSVPLAERMAMLEQAVAKLPEA